MTGHIQLCLGPQPYLGFGRERVFGNKARTSRAQINNHIQDPGCAHRHQQTFTTALTAKIMREETVLKQNIRSGLRHACVQQAIHSPCFDEGTRSKKSGNHCNPS